MKLLAAVSHPVQLHAQMLITQAFVLNKVIYYFRVLFRLFKPRQISSNNSLTSIKAVSEVATSFTHID